ncbi:hypothetical protein [Chitinibacter sp. S2-10]|uniref:hypothetical protein n=1 Tax=Chitinibacter sp. S2-10 TaxID=3373597 RepID=UPI003977D381
MKKKIILACIVLLALSSGIVGVVHYQGKADQSKADTASQVASTKMSDLTVKNVKLAELMAKSLPTDEASKDLGIILRPTLVRFTAKLLDGAKPQKADVLLAALSTMGFTPMPTVKQRIVLGYTDAKNQKQYVVTYIEEQAAQHIGKYKAGDMLEFTAVHAYNYSRGPGLMIIAFTPAQ